MKMKRVLLAAAVMATSLSGAASAADLRARARPVYTPAAPVRAFYNWTGCYVGGNGGGFWARRDWSDRVFGFGDFGGQTASGGLGGFQGGCNYQMGPWVLGIQGDWDCSPTTALSNALISRIVLAPPCASLRFRGSRPYS
jgi:outer membrane immunogenic protein